MRYELNSALIHLQCYPTLEHINSVINIPFLRIGLKNRIKYVLKIV